jgi:hypothetical protein
VCNNNDYYDDYYGDDDSADNAKRNSTEYKSNILMEMVCNSHRDTVFRYPSNAVLTVWPG